MIRIARERSFVVTADTVVLFNTDVLNTFSRFLFLFNIFIFAVDVIVAAVVVVCRAQLAVYLSLHTTHNIELPGDKGQ